MAIRTSEEFFVVSAIAPLKDKVARRAQYAQIKAAGISGDFRTRADAEAAVKVAHDHGLLDFEPSVNPAFSMGF